MMQQGLMMRLSAEHTGQVHVSSLSSNTLLTATVFIRLWTG